jgi:hypothetical protein
MVKMLVKGKWNGQWERSHAFPHVIWKEKLKCQYDEEALFEWQNEFYNLNLIFNKKIILNSITFTLLLWKLRNDKYANHLIHGFPMKLKMLQGCTFQED